MRSRSQMARPKRVVRELVYHVTCHCGGEFTENCFDDDNEPESLECPVCGDELTMPEYMGEFD